MNSAEHKNPKPSLGQKAVNGGIMVSLTQVAGTAIGLLATMFLARLVTIESFGLLAKVTAVTGIVRLLGDLGLSLATIQCKTINQKQLSAFFWINLIISAAVAIGMLVTAPLIANFFDDPRVYMIVWVMALNIAIKGAGVQHLAYLTRLMRFRTISMIAVWSQIIAAALSVFLAWFGWQYWALLMQFAFQTVIQTILLWISSGFRPSFHFFGTGIREQLKMGGSFTASNFVNYFARNADNVIIAKYWGETSVALYAKSYKLLLLPLQKLGYPMSRVAVPALSKLQDTPDEFRQFFRKGFQVALYLQIPITIFTALAGREIILCFLGPNWTDAIPIFYALIPNLVVSTSSPATSWIVLSTGKTTRYFKCVLVNAVLLTATFLIAVPYGVLTVAWSFSIVSCIVRVPTILYAIHPSPVNSRDIFPLMFHPVMQAIIAAIPLLAFIWWNPISNVWILLPLKATIFFLIYYLVSQSTVGARIVRSEAKKRLRKLPFFQRSNPAVRASH